MGAVTWSSPAQLEPDPESSTNHQVCEETKSTIETKETNQENVAKSTLNENKEDSKVSHVGSIDESNVRQGSSGKSVTGEYDTSGSGSRNFEESEINLSTDTTEFEDEEEPEMIYSSDVAGCDLNGNEEPAVAQSSDPAGCDLNRNEEEPEIMQSSDVTGSCIDVNKDEPEVTQAHGLTRSDKSSDEEEPERRQENESSGSNTDGIKEEPEIGDGNYLTSCDIEDDEELETRQRSALNGSDVNGNEEMEVRHDEESNAEGEDAETRERRERKRVEMENFRRKLAEKRSERQKAIASIAEEMRNLRKSSEELESEREERRRLEAHVTALKDVAAISREMLRIREIQVTDLKAKVESLESSSNSDAAELRVEYEKQMENMRSLRQLYDERAAAMAVEHQREVERERAKAEVLELKLQDQETALRDKDDEMVELRESAEKHRIENEKKTAELAELKERATSLASENGTLSSQMTLINNLFSHMLTEPDLDFDKLTRLLQENHNLINDLTVKGDINETAALLVHITRQAEAGEAPKEAPQDVTTTQQEIATNLPKVWRVLLELLSHYSAPTAVPLDADKTNACYKDIETPYGTRSVISVSQTFLRLKDLILEKNSLVKEVGRLKTLNTTLESRLENQEKRLSLVSNELHKTWGVVSKMRMQHKQLHTSEQILRYELQHKRLMLNEMKEELEYCRVKWEEARKKNDQSEEDWQELRKEFAARKIRQTSNSAESGYDEDDSGQIEETSDSPSEDADEIDLPIDDTEDDSSLSTESEVGSDATGSETVPNKANALIEVTVENPGNQDIGNGNVPDDDSLLTKGIAEKEPRNETVSEKVGTTAKATGSETVSSRDTSPPKETEEKLTEEHTGTESIHVKNNLRTEDVTEKEIFEVTSVLPEVSTADKPSETGEETTLGNNDLHTNKTLENNVSTVRNCSSQEPIDKMHNDTNREFVAVKDDLNEEDAPEKEISEMDGESSKESTADGHKRTEASADQKLETTDEHEREDDRVGECTDEITSLTNEADKKEDSTTEIKGEGLRQGEKIEKSEIVSQTMVTQTSRTIEISSETSIANSITQESYVSSQCANDTHETDESSTSDEVLDARALRLKRLEEQCSSLLSKMSKTSKRGDSISDKLEQLHVQYGSSEAGTSNGDSSCTKIPPSPTQTSNEILVDQMETENTKEIENCEAELDARALRLRRLEEQCSSLLSKMSETNENGNSISNKLEQLHAQYGSSEAGVSNDNCEPKIESDKVEKVENNSSVECKIEKTEDDKDREKVLDTRAVRLKKLEEQCTSLLSKMSKTSTRGDSISEKLEVLHTKYGSSEAGTSDHDSELRTEQSTIERVEEVPVVESKEEKKDESKSCEEILDARALRLKRLEEQCTSLLSKMSRTSRRGDSISDKLEQLHIQYGSAESDNERTRTATSRPRLQRMKRHSESTSEKDPLSPSGTAEQVATSHSEELQCQEATLPNSVSNRITVGPTENLNISAVSLENVPCRLVVDCRKIPEEASETSTEVITMSSANARESVSGTLDEGAVSKSVSEGVVKVVDTNIESTREVTEGLEVLNKHTELPENVSNRVNTSTEETLNTTLNSSEISKKSDIDNEDPRERLCTDSEEDSQHTIMRSNKFLTKQEVFGEVSGLQGPIIRSEEVLRRSHSEEVLGGLTGSEDASRARFDELSRRSASEEILGGTTVGTDEVSRETTKRPSETSRKLSSENISGRVASSEEDSREVVTRPGQFSRKSSAGDILEGITTAAEEVSRGDMDSLSVTIRNTNDRLENRAMRLKMLENQCQTLFKRVSITSYKREALSNRLEELHEHYGSGENITPLELVSTFSGGQTDVQSASASRVSDAVPATESPETSTELPSSSSDAVPMTNSLPGLVLSESVLPPSLVGVPDDLRVSSAGDGENEPNDVN